MCYFWNNARMLLYEQRMYLCSIEVVYSLICLAICTALCGRNLGLGVENITPNIAPPGTIVICLFLSHQLGNMQANPRPHGVHKAIKEMYSKTQWSASTCTLWERHIITAHITVLYVHITKVGMYFPNSSFQFSLRPIFQVLAIMAVKHDLLH